MMLLRVIISLIVMVIIWQCITWLTDTPHYILPSPLRVISSLWINHLLLLEHLSITALEICLGLVFGTVFGFISALSLMWSSTIRRWLLPLLVISQAIPVFAIAPLLVLWLGYGVTSKVAMATLIIYFPVAATLYDGLRRTNIGWLELAKTMGASPFSVLLHIRLPAAMPAMSSGLRVAAAVAPIGAVVGEWVGASSGLGYLMLHANGRMETDLMFAALFTLAVISLFIYFTIDFTLRRTITWQPDSLLTDFEELK